MVHLKIEIVKKINGVAYRLAFPAHNSIFLVFHIALLNPFIGATEDAKKLQLPTTALDAHPLVVPATIRSYRTIGWKGGRVEKVLVE